MTKEQLAAAHAAMLLGAVESFDFPAHGRRLICVLMRESKWWEIFYAVAIGDPERRTALAYARGEPISLELKGSLFRSVGLEHERTGWMSNDDAVHIYAGYVMSL